MKIKLKTNKENPGTANRRSRVFYINLEKIVDKSANIGYTETAKLAEYQKCKGYFYVYRDSFVLFCLSTTNLIKCKFHVESVDIEVLA
ncbi:MAG: hypothetical protein E7680_05550 [Ruminococcaceae bacterium]|nr:hypothetical protein [Oscillospiraceae bacterium]